jgi:hypothetical protein
MRNFLPCDLDRFCRNHYFTGKLLTARDLTLEQRYMRDKLRLHHRVLHGWGVACGLLVKPHPYCPDLRIIVEPGVAIDQCGYEIVVPIPVEIELPRPSRKRMNADNPCPPDEQGHDTGKEKYAANGRQQYGGNERGRTNEYKSWREPCDPAEPSVPLAVCIRYAECEEEFAPAPFDECGCNAANRRQPSRICEGFAIELRLEEPDRIEPCAETNCADLFRQALEPCAQPQRPNCIPLAFIEDYRRGETVIEQRINNRDYRPLLASTHLLERVLRCLADRAPGQTLTRVQDIGWTHAQEYHCHDFLKFYTGNSESEGSFSVEFESPVRSDAWNRTFQAIVVRDRGRGPAGQLELAPARVWQSADRRRCYLQIDRSWAEQELRDIRFDVYLTLRCGLILDDDGRPVDGNLLARLVEDDKYLVAPPTGNGLPGGTLESWITVRR